MFNVIGHFQPVSPTNGWIYIQYDNNLYDNNLTNNSSLKNIHIFIEIDFHRYKTIFWFIFTYK